MLEVEGSEHNLVKLFEADAAVYHLLDEDGIALVHTVNLSQVQLDVRVYRRLFAVERRVALDAVIDELCGLHHGDVRAAATAETRSCCSPPSLVAAHLLYNAVNGPTVSCP